MQEYQTEEASPTPGQRQSTQGRNTSRGVAPPSPLKSWAIGWLRCRADGIPGRLSVGRCRAVRLLAQGGGSLGDAVWVTEGTCPQREASCCCPPGAAASARLEGCRRRAHRNPERAFPALRPFQGPLPAKLSNVPAGRRERVRVHLHYLH